MIDRLRGPGLRHADLWRGVGFFGVAAVIWLSLTPEPPELRLDPSNWSGHGLAYAVLMGWFARIQYDEGTRRYVALALCLLGVTIECAQGLTPWRTFDVLDMVANAIGVAFGWLASPPRMPNGLPTIERLLARGRRGR